MQKLIFIICLLFTVLLVKAQPANDNCANAIPLVVDAPCVAGTNVNATGDGNPSCGLLTFYADKTVWYSFVATGPNTQISVTNVAGDLDVIMTLYNSCGAGSFKCVDANGNNSNESVVQNTISGNTYWICIEGAGAIWPFTGNEDGTFCIQVSTYIAPPNPSGDCSGAQPFCTGTTYQFPAGTNTQSQTGPNYGCLGTQPNPAWYYLKISQNGPIDIHMASDAGVDIDFICWGPFPSTNDACTQISAGGGAQVDCSYSTAAEEDCNIPNGIVGEYYMLLITNYSNQPTNIIFSQTGGSGATDCSIINPIIAQNNGPFCPDQTLQLNATNVTNAVYSWSGPNGFTSGIRNPTITNLTTAASGVYTLTTTINATVYTSTTTVTVFAANSPECFHSVVCTIGATAADSAICIGSSTTIQGTGTIGTAVLSNTFDNGTVGVGWIGTPTANFTNPACAAAPPYGTTFMWMDNATPAPRNLESNDFNVLYGGIISFWLKFAVQAQGVPCEGPDEGGEGVTLQYSTTNGTSWTDIVYFSPNGTQMATNPDPGYTNHAQVATGATAFTNWARYLFPIPAAAWTTSSRFRWMQYHSTDANTDNWGIDSVLIVTPPQGVTITWTSNPPGFNQTGNGPFTVSPTVTTWYIATISDGTNSCVDSVKVSIANVSAGFTINDSTQCVGSNNFVFTSLGASGTGINYFWNFGDSPAISNLVNPFHSYANPGTYIVTQAAMLGTCADTITRKVFVYAEPTLTFDSVPSCQDICTGTLIVYPAGVPGPFTYSWSNGATTQAITGICGGNYSVTVTDGNGCISVGSTTVTEYSVPSVNIDSVPSCHNVCNGSLSAYGSGTIGPYNYYWSNNINAQTINNLCVGNYTVTVKDGNNCSGTGSNVVVYYPGINITLSSTKAKCNGENTGTATALASGGGGNGIFTYQWGFNANNQNTATAIGLYAGNYQVTVTDNLGCIIDSSVIVSQPAPLVITTCPDTNLCYQTSGTVWANPTGGISPYTFHWNGVIGGSPLTVSPLVSTAYSVFVTDSNNCISNTGTIYVSVDPKLEIHMYAEDTMICPGSYAVINSYIIGGDGGPYYVYDGQWNNVEMPYKPFPSNSPQNFYLIAKDRCGSFAKDTLTIYMHPLPLIMFSSDKFSGCQPLTVQFNEGTNNPGSEYLWNFNDVDNSLSQYRNPVHTFEVPGVYDIALTVTSVDGCQNTYTVPQMITVYSKPEARFNSVPELVSIIEPVVSFYNQSSNYVTSIWNFDDGDSSLFNNPVHIFEAIGKYDISLVAISDHGCKDTTVQEIYVRDEYTFYAPSAFSPDANGINDVFNVYGHGINPAKFVMYIYDRWGQILFETTDLTKGWDGKLTKSGSGKDVVKSGVYTWFVVYTDFSGVVHQKTGPVTVIH